MSRHSSSCWESFFGKFHIRNTGATISFRRYTFWPTFYDPDSVFGYQYKFWDSYYTVHDKMANAMQLLNGIVNNMKSFPTKWLLNVIYNCSNTFGDKSIQQKKSKQHFEKKLCALSLDRSCFNQMRTSEHPLHFWRKAAWRSQLCKAKMNYIVVQFLDACLLSYGGTPLASFGSNFNIFFLTVEFFPMLPTFH